MEGCEALSYRHTKEGKHEHKAGMPALRPHLVEQGGKHNVLCVPGACKCAKSRKTPYGNLLPLKWLGVPSDGDGGCDGQHRSEIARAQGSDAGMLSRPLTGHLNSVLAAHGQT